MATTSKLGLYLPQGTDLVDIKQAHNDQMALIDNNLRVVVLAHLTDKPVGDFNGQFAYAEDVSELYYWKASTTSWIYICSRKNGWGKKGRVFTDIASPEVGANQETGPYLSLTYNQLIGRIYKVSWTVETDSPNTGNFGDNKLRFRYKMGSSVDVVDTEINWMWLDHMNNGGTNSVSHSGGFTYTAESTGQITIGMFLAKIAGGAKIYLASSQHNEMIIEDIGWNG